MSYIQVDYNTYKSTTSSREPCIIDLANYVGLTGGEIKRANHNRNLDTIEHWIATSSSTMPFKYQKYKVVPCSNPT